MRELQQSRRRISESSHPILGKASGDDVRAIQGSHHQPPRSPETFFEPLGGPPMRIEPKLPEGSL
jgi:hypothetical protein